MKRRDNFIPAINFYTLRIENIWKNQRIEYSIPKIFDKPISRDFKNFQLSNHIRFSDLNFRSVGELRNFDSNIRHCEKHGSRRKL